MIFINKQSQFMILKIIKTKQKNKKKNNKLKKNKKLNDKYKRKVNKILLLIKKIKKKF